MFSLQTNELKDKNGNSVHLRRQSSNVPAFLSERRGELVTRKELALKRYSSGVRYKPVSGQLISVWLHPDRPDCTGGDDLRDGAGTEWVVFKGKAARPAAIAAGDPLYWKSKIR